MNDYHKIQKTWAANDKMPLTRDEQIEMMKTAKERHEAFVIRMLRANHKGENSELD